MNEGQSQIIRGERRRTIWTPGRLITAAGATALVLCMLASGGAAATSASYGPSAGDYALASVPGITSIAVSPTQMFATSSVNCSQVLSVSPTGTVSLYAVLPIPVSKCGEGSVALAPPGWGSSTAYGTWGTGDRSDGGAWGNNPGNEGNWGNNQQSQGQCGCGNQKAPPDTLWDAQESQLYEITNHGSTVTLFASFAKTGSDMGLVYDSVGSFGHDLIVTGSSGRVWTVNQTGGVTLLANLKVHIEGPAVAPWSFGAYGGDVLVAAQGKNTVYAINSTGVVSSVTTWASAESIAFPSNCGCGFGATPAVFFVANVTSGTIEAFPASYFTTLRGLGFVDSETNGGIGSFNSAGTTTTLASHTRHLEQIAFVQCFGYERCCGGSGYGGSNGYKGGNWNNGDQWYGGNTWNSGHSGFGWGDHGW